jgi:DNA-binding transcriptional LysR family regulator
MRVLLGPHWPEIVELFENHHPGCRVTFVDTGRDRDYLDWLRTCDVDMVVCWLPVSPPEFTVGPIIQRDDRVLIVGRNHPLAERDSVSIEDLAEYQISDVPAFNREMMDTFIPPVTPSGKRLRGVAPTSPEER